jgi:hypothetical protein
MARHLLKRVRELWAEEIADDSVVDGSFDSGDLIAAYKDLLGMQKRKLDVGDEAILAVIEASPAAAAKRRKTAADVFLMLAEREATSEELDSLHGMTDIADIAVKAKAMLDDTPPLSRDAGMDLDEGESLYTIPETDDEEKSPLVDEAWIVDFVEAYKREPFVHEYMHLRGGAYGPLEDTFKVYGNTLAQMREVYSDYLNDQLGEGRFARLYTPAMYEDAELVQKIVLSVTDSDEYAQAMKGRLAHLYKVLFGDDLMETDTAYIFEKWVQGDRLSLTCYLNQIIVGYKDEADIHAADMTELWEDVLARKPLEREIALHRHAYRMDTAAARSAAHSELVKSREFTHVITARIQERKPDIPTFEVYELLDKILANYDLVGTPLDVCIDASVGVV